MASTTVSKSCQVVTENDNAPHSNPQNDDFYTHYRAELIHYTISWLVILIPRKLTYGMEYRSGTVSVLMDDGARTRWTALLITSFDPTLRMSYTLRETSEWNTHTTHEKISSVKKQGTRNRIDWLKKEGVHRREDYTSRNSRKIHGIWDFGLPAHRCHLAREAYSKLIC